MRRTAKFALGIAIAFASCGSAASDEPPKKAAVANLLHPSSQVRHAAPTLSQVQHAAPVSNQAQHAPPTSSQVKHAAPASNQVRHAASPASNQVQDATTIPNQVRHAGTISNLRRDGGAVQSRTEAGGGETDGKSARFETPVVGSPEWNSRQTEEEGKEKELNRIIHSICHNC